MLGGGRGPLTPSDHLFPHHENGSRGLGFSSSTGTGQQQSTETRDPAITAQEPSTTMVVYKGDAHLQLDPRVRLQLPTWTSPTFFVPSFVGPPFSYIPQWPETTFEEIEDPLTIERERECIVGEPSFLPLPPPPSKPSEVQSPKQPEFGGMEE